MLLKELQLTPARGTCVQPWDRHENTLNMLPEVFSLAGRTHHGAGARLQSHTSHFSPACVAQLPCQLVPLALEFPQLLTVRVLCRTCLHEVKVGFRGSGEGIRVRLGKGLGAQVKGLGFDKGRV